MKLNLRKIILGLFIAAGGLLTLVIATLAVLIYTGVTVDLSFLKSGVEASAQKALGREVKIQGPVVFEFSHWTSIEVKDVQVANVAQASDPVFLNAGLARLEIGLFMLLKGEIRIGEVTVENVALNLESDTKGQPNWIFKPSTAKKPTPPDDKLSKDAKPSEPSAQKDEQGISFGGLHELTLKKIAVTYRDASLKKTVRFKLDRLYGEASPGKPITLDIKGSLQKYTYALRFHGSSLEDLADKDTPWKFKLTGDIAGKQVKATGDMVVRNDKPNVNLDLTVDDVDVGAILGKLKLVEGMQAKTGSVRIKISLNGKSLNEIVRQSRILFAVRNGQWTIAAGPTSKASIDLRELTGDIIVEKGNNVTMKLAGKLNETPVKLLITGAPLVDYVEVPDEVPLTIDAEFAGTRLSFSGKVALPVTKRDLSLALKISGERLDNLNDLFKLNLPPIGPVALETRLDVTENGYDLSTLDLKVGESHLAGKMKLDMSADKAPLAHIELISELIRFDDFNVGKSDSEDREKDAELSEPGLKAPVETAGKKAPEKKVSAEYQNLLSQDVLKKLNATIKIEAKQVTFRQDALGSVLLNVTLGDAGITESAATPPNSSPKAVSSDTQRELSLVLKISGERLNNFNDLLKLNLPPLGPVEFETQMDISKNRYDLSKLNLKFGESRLSGKMKLEKSADKPPHAEIELVSELIRTDDFDFGKSKSKDKDEAKDAEPAEPKQKKPVETDEEAPAKKAESQHKNLLSHDVLKKFNANIKIEAKQVTSGKDELGSTLLKVTLQDSRLAVKPLKIDIPGGGIEIVADYLPAENDITVNLAAKIEEFDFGILARRAKPETDMGGRFSLDAALHSKSPDFRSMLANAQGHFDFALVPQNFSSGIIDLWAVNLLSAIMSKASEKDKSQINCLVVRLGMQDGLMLEKAIYMDTTEMRIAGKAAINFKTHKIDILMAPKSKKPEFFSLATPIKVEGAFDDFGIGIGAARLTKSLFSFITSPIHVPIRRVFVKDAPADGKEACRAAWKKTGAESERKQPAQ